MVPTRVYHGSEDSKTRTRTEIGADENVKIGIHVGSKAPLAESADGRLEVIVDVDGPTTFRRRFAGSWRCRRTGRGWERSAFCYACDQETETGWVSRGSASSFQILLVVGADPIVDRRAMGPTAALNGVGRAVQILPLAQFFSNQRRSRFAQSLTSRQISLS